MVHNNPLYQQQSAGSNGLATSSCSEASGEELEQGHGGGEYGECSSGGLEEQHEEDLGSTSTGLNPAALPACTSLLAAFTQQLCSPLVLPALVRLEAKCLHPVGKGR